MQGLSRNSEQVFRSAQVLESSPRRWVDSLLSIIGALEWAGWHARPLRPVASAGAAEATRLAGLGEQMAGEDRADRVDRLQRLTPCVGAGEAAQLAVDRIQLHRERGDDRGERPKICVRGLAVSCKSVFEVGVEGGEAFVPAGHRSFSALIAGRTTPRRAGPSLVRLSVARSPWKSRR